MFLIMYVFLTKDYNNFEKRITQSYKNRGQKNKGLTTNSGPIFDAEFENHSHFSPTRTDFS